MMVMMVKILMGSRRTMRRADVEGGVLGRRV